MKDTKSLIILIGTIVFLFLTSRKKVEAKAEVPAEIPAPSKIEEFLIFEEEL